MFPSGVAIAIILYNVSNCWTLIPIAAKEKIIKLWTHFKVWILSLLSPTSAAEFKEVGLELMCGSYTRGVCAYASSPWWQSGILYRREGKYEWTAPWQITQQSCDKGSGASMLSLHRCAFKSMSGEVMCGGLLCTQRVQREAVEWYPCSVRPQQILWKQQKWLYGACSPRGGTAWHLKVSPHRMHITTFQCPWNAIQLMLSILYEPTLHVRQL